MRIGMRLAWGLFEFSFEDEPPDEPVDDPEAYEGHAMTTGQFERDSEPLEPPAGTPGEDDRRRGFGFTGLA